MSRPIIFFSYRRSDDHNLNGLLSRIRATLEQRLKVNFGIDAEVFQDSDDLRSGDNWPEKLDSAIGDAAILLPMITPNFFNSEYCRDELIKFVTKEKALARSDMVIPVLLIPFADYSIESKDPLIAQTARRQHVDWARFKAYLNINQELLFAIDKLAEDITQKLRSTITESMAVDTHTQPPREPLPVRSGQARPPTYLGRSFRALAIVIGVAVTGVLFFALRRYPVRPTPSRLPRPGVVRFESGAFTMGSSTDEQVYAHAECRRSAPRPDQHCPLSLFAREAPQRRVLLSAFELGQAEVTNRKLVTWLATKRLEIQLEIFDGQREAVVYSDGEAILYVNRAPGLEASLREPQPVIKDGWAPRPATGVTWLGARAYCLAQGGDLPTEAQWERAARGTEGRRFPWGDRAPSCEEVVFARITGLTCAGLGTSPAQAEQPGQDRTPNGVFHMAGNVAEWVLDGFRDRYAGCPEVCRDPVTLNTTSNKRVLRGGSIHTLVDSLRGAYRSRLVSDQSDTNVGFRCAWRAGHEG